MKKENAPEHTPAVPSPKEAVGTAAPMLPEEKAASPRLLKSAGAESEGPGSEKSALLPGGSENQVEKIDGTVHRKPQGPKLLHRYLQYLEEKGMPGVPRFLGMDEKGREVLTYLPGQTMGRDFPPTHPCLYTDDTLIAAARFVRRLHDVSAGFLEEARAGGWKDPFFPERESEIICHGDAGIWNFVFQNNVPAGLFDFDQAHPGTRLWDLTTTLFSVVPLTYFVFDPQRGDTVDYDPQKHASERRRRVCLFFEAYGTPFPQGIFDLTLERIEKDFCGSMERGAAAGDETCLRMIREGQLLHYQKIAAHLRAHKTEWL